MVVLDPSLREGGVASQGGRGVANRAQDGWGPEPRGAGTARNVQAQPPPSPECSREKDQSRWAAPASSLCLLVSDRHKDPMLPAPVSLCVLSLALWEGGHLSLGFEPVLEMAEVLEKSPAAADRIGCCHL